MWTGSSTRPNHQQGSLWQSLRATIKTEERRMRTAGRIHSELIASHLLLWEHNHGVRTRGISAMPYVDSIWADTGLNDTEEIDGLITNRVL